LRSFFHSIVLTSLLLSPAFADESWDNAVPPAEKFDWVQTTSGEWLKGTIKGMYDRELEFDSDKFNLQTIKDKDIKQLISASNTSVNIEGRGTFIGKLYIHDDIVILSTEDESFELERKNIISLTNGGDRERSNWQGKVSLGVTISSGNTEKEEYTAMADIKRQTSSTRLAIAFLGAYSRAEDIKTEDNRRASAAIDIFQTRRFFWRPAFSEYYSDSFQNILDKATLGAGVGYDIYAQAGLDWTLFVGLAYQSTEFIDVPAGQDDRVETPAFVITSDYNYDITGDIEFIFKYQAYLVNKDSGSYVQHAKATLETELINDFSIDLSFIWDRIQNPAESFNETGTITPQQDDYKSIASVAYSF